MKPRFLLGITIIVWGLQTHLIWIAVPMAILLESRHLLNRRWALTQKDFYLLADLTSIGLLGVIVFLFLNARTYHFLLTLFQWLPVVMFPLTLVFAFSTTEKMTLDVLFRSLRKQKEPVRQSWHTDYLLFSLCLLATATNTNDHALYFPFIVVAILTALYPLRATRYQHSFWILTAATIILSATLTHQTLRAGHLALKAKTEQWIADWLLQQTDPLKSRTALGKVGKLKLSDAISFRIKADQGFPRLIQEASYDLPRKINGLEWSVMQGSFQQVPHSGDFTWDFASTSPAKSPRQAEIFLEFDKESALIPVPASLVEIDDLPALQVSINDYGAIQGSGLVPSPSYHISYDDGQALLAAPRKSDTYIPPEFEPLMNQIVSKGNYPAAAAVAYVKAYFSDFSYSLYQPRAENSEDPLQRFVFDQKSGHCEYFASATALMLRQLGVPSRYVVGYAVQEYNEALSMYVVRQRHAHAWVIAFVDGQWQVVDTTPSSWQKLEDANADVLQPVSDVLSNYSFMFQRWWNSQKIEDYETELYILAGILLLLLIWRITTSEQVILENKGIVSGSDQRLDDRDSPFFKLEKRFTELGLKRGQGELLRTWLVRIGKQDTVPLLAIHNQIRFDSVKVPGQIWQQLEERVQHELAIADEPTNQ